MYYREVDDVSVVSTSSHDVSKISFEGKRELFEGKRRSNHIKNDTNISVPKLKKETVLTKGDHLIFHKIESIHKMSMTFNIL